MGLVLLVTALAQTGSKMDFFGKGSEVDNWWAFYMLIPIGWFVMDAVRRWQEGDRKNSRQMARVALMIIPIFAAFLYSPLWEVIYIPFVALLGVDMILAVLLFRQPPEKTEKDKDQSSNGTSDTK